MPFCKRLPPFLHQQKVPLAKFSTFGIGGPAEFLCYASSTDHMQQQIHFASEENLPYIIVGKGSNILFDDRGYKGLVIISKLEQLVVEENVFIAGSGYSFPRLGTLSAKQGYSGLEFAAAIPASVGGAVFMNAGAGGQETSDCLLWVDFLQDNGQTVRLEKKDLEFSYRFSSFQAKKGAILQAAFALKKEPLAMERQKKDLAYRLETQPYGQKSIGCIFQNPKPLSAGRMIEEMGLKGLRVGGVSVSTKHANFIVNNAQGTAEDVKKLIEIIKKQTFEEKGVWLHEEIRYINYDDSF